MGMKKVILSVVAGLLVFLSFFGEYEKGLAQTAFSDLDRTDWGYEAIHYLVKKKVIQGYPDGTFRPDRKLQRREAAKMVGKALGLNGKRRKTHFPDVNPNGYASGYIQSLYEKGYILGYPDGKFHPKRKMQRDEMAYLISRAFSLDKIGKFLPYTDVHQDKPNYNPINKVTTAGITEGYRNGTFRPADNITRREFAIMVARAVNKDFRPTKSRSVIAEGVVTAHGLNVRQGPSTNYHTLGKPLSQGTSVKIYNKVGGWGFISAGDRKGYVSLAYVREKSEPSLSQMTLSEKVGQMVMVGINGTQVGSDAEKLIRRYHVGGIILYGKNIQTPDQTVRLINRLKTKNANADNPLPLFISVDQEGGRVERLPDAIASLPSQGSIGKMNDPHYSRQIGQLIGEELSAFGFNMDFAPVLDIISHPGQSVIGDRSFGSDKHVVSELGVATMKGIQSQNVISVVKHFPGYGEVSADAHTSLPTANVGLNRLENVDWVPYKRAIVNGADAVMVTHIMLPKLDSHYPSSMSRKIITGMLRNKLGFHGVVITDDMTMGAIEKNYGIDQAAVQAVKAGADVILVAFNDNQQISVLNALKHAVKSGEISKSRINQSVRRIMQLKEKYNLSNARTDDVNVDQINRKIHSVLK